MHQSSCTLPLGGLVNHSVHSFIKGCLTLKLSGSSNTVTCLSPDFAASLAPSSDAILGSLFSSLGEIGIVSRGTCELGLSEVGAVSDAVITRRERMQEARKEGGIDPTEGSTPPAQWNNRRLRLCNLSFKMTTASMCVESKSYTGQRKWSKTRSNNRCLDMNRDCHF